MAHQCASCRWRSWPGPQPAGQPAGRAPPPWQLPALRYYLALLQVHQFIKSGSAGQVVLDAGGECDWQWARPAIDTNNWITSKHISLGGPANEAGRCRRHTEGRESYLARQSRHRWRVLVARTAPRRLPNAPQQQQRQTDPCLQPAHIILNTISTRYPSTALRPLGQCWLRV